MNARFTAFRNHSGTGDTITLPTEMLLHLLHIHDSAFPIGGYTHTFGMETYIASGEIADRNSLLIYLKNYLVHNLVSAEAVVMREAFRLTQKEDWAALHLLDRRCHAMKIAQESRLGSQRIGRQFLKAVAAINPDPLLVQWTDRLKRGEVQGHLAVCYGLYAARIGLDERAAIATYLYVSLVSLVYNAVRAIPLGQQDGMMVIDALEAEIGRLVSRVQNAAVNDISNRTPGQELASMKHAFLYSRLFIS